ncbi:hypothetical protein SAMN05443253_101259 [Bacillus sp. OK048]|nr:hypothetical protein SAMN05443253_101259 [Bacillus sp. OK048]
MPRTIKEVKLDELVLSNISSERARIYKTLLMMKEK